MKFCDVLIKVYNNVKPSKVEEKTHVVLSFCGIKFKLRKNFLDEEIERNISEIYLDGAKDISKVNNCFNIQKQNNKVVIFAMFSKYGTISDNLLTFNLHISFLCCIFALS